MKNRKLILIHFLFLGSMFILTHLLNKYYFIKWVFIYALIIGLTYMIFLYLSKAQKLFKGFLINIFSLFLIFELMKASEYLLGLMPKYTENLFVSIAASFISIALYVGFIALLCYLIKIISKKRIPS